MEHSFSTAHEGEPPVSASPPQTRSTANSDLDDVARRLMRTLDASGVAIAVQLSNDPEFVLCMVSRGNVAPPVGSLLDVNSGISGRCIRENRAMHSFDTAIDPRVDQEACKRLGIRSLALAPLRRDSRCVGVLEVFSASPGAFDTTSLKTIKEAATLAADVINRDSNANESKVPEKAESKIASAGLTQQPPKVATEKPIECALNESGNASDVESNVPELRGFLGVSPVRTRRWIVMALVAASGAVAFSASRMVQRERNSVSHSRNGANAVGHVTESNSVGPVMLPAVRLDSTTTAELISDAGPSVRVLMAKALAGNSEAQLQLADHYAKGDDVARDRVKATAWYIMSGAHANRRAKQLAVEMTHELQPFEVAQARFNVGAMFRDGVGTKKDLVAAYSWFVLAKAAGDIRAVPEQEKLEKLMTADQLAQARSHANEWLASHRSRPLRSGQTVATNRTGGR